MSQPLKKAIVLMSGGLDSLCVLATVIDQGYTPLLLHIEYGQRTKRREKKAFDQIGDYYNIPRSHSKYLSASYLGQLGGSSLTDMDIPISKDELHDKHIPSSYVPFRNTHLIATAVSWAEVIKANKIFIGANEEDSPGYPDCRPAYYEAYNQLIKQGTKDANITIETPIIKLSKKEIISQCLKLKAPIHLSWSCYASQNQACGQCASCQLRLQGFKELGISDPIPYQD